MSSPIVRSVGILLARIAFGAVFLAHGLQKFQQNGWAGPKAGFEMMDVPLPAISAFLVTWLEILGGIALIAGLLTPVVGLLFFLDMLGALFIAHIDNGIWASDGGYELVLALGAGALLLAVVGAGRFSIDAILGTKAPWLAVDGNRPATTVGSAN
ncbi:DoxX family protein [Gordonia amicalis]|uniref:DoxX family protein n=1 Tax=Gordonia amicalis TaxID=89053 RepID=UPI001FB7F820|nr:DoxX family protein [Gordonia amicalis]MDV7101258.1 DoxX family protein [Gordonia amicalis]UOG21912.1 DoxX family protein [Gordonia amicalis]